MTGAISCKEKMETFSKENGSHGKLSRLQPNTLNHSMFQSREHKVGWQVFLA